LSEFDEERERKMRKILVWFLLAAMLVSVVLTSGCSTEEAHEHVLGDWIIDTEPTKTSEGSKHIECTECQKILLTESIPMTGPMDEVELAQYARERTVAVCVDHEIVGTGFFIDDEGTVVTCFHVLEPVFNYSVQEANVEVRLYNNSSYSLQSVIKFDYAYDLAVFKIDTKGEKVSYFPIASEDPALFSKVYACGYKNGADDVSFNGGNISKVSGEEDKRGLAETYVHDADIYYGNSGGPLINAYGEAVGINAAGHRDDESSHYAIKTSNLDKVRVVGTKSLAEFMKWHNDETRDSLKVWDWDTAEEEFTGDGYYSYVHSYQDVTGVKCEFSCDYTYYFFNNMNAIPEEYRKPGFHGTKFYHTYIYTRESYDVYMEYLKSEGYKYEDEARFEDDTYYECYYSYATNNYIEFHIYTDSKTGERLLQMNIYN
jgi:hypothetical protein